MGEVVEFKDYQDEKEFYRSFIEKIKVCCSNLDKAFEMQRNIFRYERQLEVVR